MHSDPDKKPSVPPWAQVIREGVSREKIPLVVENAGGTLRNSLVSATPILGPDGKQRGVLASFTDVTELEEKSKELVEASRKAGMAEIATDVLHNIGNALNSLNVTTTAVAEKLSASRLPKLGSVAAMIAEHNQDLGHFLSEDPQGKHIPSYLVKITEILCTEHAEVLDKVQSLAANLQHVNEIIKAQQSFRRTADFRVTTSLPEVVEQAIHINERLLKAHDVAVVREFGNVQRVNIDKSRLSQILVNLIRNAVDAMIDSERSDKRLIIRFLKLETDELQVEVVDNGMGIPSENLTKIFQHGYTTKPGGHGYGLHGSALAAQEMGGALFAESEGIGHGARFVLKLPLRQKERTDERRQTTESTHTGH
jgi:signal transduction histidine kinase